MAPCDLLEPGSLRPSRRTVSHFLEMTPASSARPSGSAARRVWALAVLAAAAALLIALGRYLPGLTGPAVARFGLVAAVLAGIAGLTHAAVLAARQAFLGTQEMQRLHADNARQLQAA